MLLYYSEYASLICNSSSPWQERGFSVLSPLPTYFYFNYILLPRAKNFYNRRHRGVLSCCHYGFLLHHHHPRLLAVSMVRSFDTVRSKAYSCMLLICRGCHACLALYANILTFMSVFIFRITLAIMWSDVLNFKINWVNWLTGTSLFFWKICIFYSIFSSTVEILFFIFVNVDGYKNSTLRN